MTITSRVKKQLFEDSTQEERLIRIAPTPVRPRVNTAPSSGQAWTHEEHDLFLQALELYPSGPWKVIATHVGTKSTRQTMTHAQKYRQKIARRKRGLKIGVHPNPLEYFPMKSGQQGAQSTEKEDGTSALADEELMAMLDSANSELGQLAEAEVSTPQILLQEHKELLETDSEAFLDWELAAFLLEEYEPLYLSDDDK